MPRLLKTISLFVILLVPVISSPYAAVVVYTDRTAWEAGAVAAGLPGRFFSDDLENAIIGGMVTGTNVTNGDAGTLINIPGSPGFNSFDDSVTADPFSNALSPNGSSYYLGEIGGTSSLSIDFQTTIAGSIIYAFGGDWELSSLSTDNLTISVRSTTIVISDYLTTGSGFLGFTSDSPVFFIPLGTLGGTGTAYFGLDNIEAKVNPAPVPAAAWLFGSGLLGLIGIARHKKEA